MARAKWAPLALAGIAACVLMAGPVAAQNQRLGVAVRPVGTQAVAEQTLRVLDTQLAAVAADESSLRQTLGSGRFEALAAAAGEFVANQGSDSARAAFAEQAANANLSQQNIMAVLFFVFKESVESQNEDKKFWLEKLRQYNELGQALHDELERLRAHRCPAEPCPPFQTNARALQTSFGSAFLTSPRDLAAYQAELEQQLQSVGDDAQLANIDLQSVLQRQQQTLQTISNVSKMLHDTAMGVIRNMGG